MSASMAEVLAQHADYVNDDDSSGILCAGCFVRIVPDGDSHAGSLVGLAAHQAEVLAANGYGKLEEAKAAALREAALELMNVSEADSRMPGIRFAVGFLAGHRRPE